MALAVSLALAPAAAMAYIDPGSGAYMVQALFAFVGAVLFYLRNPIRLVKACWSWFKARFSRRVTPAAAMRQAPGPHVGLPDEGEAAVDAGGEKF